MAKTAILLKDISKKYTLYNNKIDRLKDSLSFSKSKKYSKEFYALNNINIQINSGESVGIIGKNGSGKSTLLKIITGVLNPTEGNLEVNGHISAILELGAGFNPEYTGLENIYLSGTILGYSKEEMDKKLPEIIEFAELGDFINQPVKNYSSGMYVRLAFSVAISVDPEILIVDEALSVGDIRFQQKCLRKIDQLKTDKTILFVSHDLLQLKKFCQRLIWINEGVIMADGDPEKVSKQYKAYMAGSNLTTLKNEHTPNNINSTKSNIKEIAENLQVFGDQRAVIKGISVFDEEANNIYDTNIGDKVTIGLEVQVNQKIENPIVGITIKDRVGNIVTQTNSYVLDTLIPPINVNETKIFKFSFVIPPLKKGHYTISPAIASGDQYEHTQHCWIHDAVILKVEDNEMYDLEGYMVLKEVELDVE